MITGLFNWVESDREVLSLRLGEQREGSGLLSRYRSFSAGVSYLMARNLRLLAEITLDPDGGSQRFVAGLVTAF